MTVGRNGINVVRNGRTVWEPNPCGTPHHNYPETRCTEPAGHYRPDRDPHAGPLIIDGREVGAAAWDEPKESSMTDQTATQATDLDNPRADALAAEWHRRHQRLEELAKGPNAQVTIVEHVRGELIGLRGALGILLGGQVQDGTADLLGWAYCQEWRRRQEGRAASGVREVRVVVQAPSDENADRWTETIRDLVLAEYGDSMRLEVTILPGGRS